MAPENDNLTSEHILALVRTINTSTKELPEVFSFGRSGYDCLTRIKIKLINDKDLEPEKWEKLTAIKSAIEEFHRLGPLFLQKKTMEPDITDDDFVCAFLYFKDLVDGGDPADGFYLREHVDVFRKVWSKRKAPTLLDARYLTTMVAAYQRLGYPWRGRQYAALLENVMKKVPFRDGYDELIRFYQNVRDLPHAIALAEEATRACLKVGKVSLGATYARKAYQMYRILPLAMRYIPSDDEIRKTFGEHATEVLRYRSHKPNLAVDPVEHTADFRAVYDEVMEATEKRLAEEGDAHIPQQRWSIMTEEFYKRGVEWKDPGTMNPGVMFD